MIEEGVWVKTFVLLQSHFVMYNNYKAKAITFICSIMIKPVPTGFPMYLYV